MTQPLEAVRDFLLHLEKAVALRRLYAASSPHYREVVPKLLEKLLPAAGYQGFTVHLTARDLRLEEKSLLHRPDPEDSFFFPLYRDGVRELSFTPAVTEEELEALLAVLEAGRRRRMGPEEDAVVLLWQSGLDGIGFRAIDGIGDQEAGEEDGKNEYGTLAGRLAEQLRSPSDPAPPDPGDGRPGEARDGPSYGFVIDADVRLADGDLHYDGATVRRTFEEHPRVLRLTAEEVAGLRAEVADEDERRLLDRFLEILLAMALDPAGTVSVESVAPVLEQVIHGLWSAGDLAGLAEALARLQHAAERAPSPEARRALRSAVEGFFTGERVTRTCALVGSGELDFAAAAGLWEIAGDRSWSPLLAFWAGLPPGALANRTATLLRQRSQANPELLRGSLESADPDLVRAALLLLDERGERAYAPQVVALAAHADEAIRLRALPAVGRLGDGRALDALWRAMEADPARSVRLLAFRLVAGAPLPGLRGRLEALVSAPAFRRRPLWERRKYVSLLAEVGGPSVRQVFESMLPSRRWFWRLQQQEAAELGLCGLAAIGGDARQWVRAQAARRDSIGRLAQRVLGGGEAQ
jgi:hypothetical protein